MEYAIIGILGAAVVWLTIYARRMKIRYRQRGLLGSYPIGGVHLHEISPRFRTTDLGPTRDAEVSLVGHGPILAPGATTDAESWVLAVLARDATTMFEFGTATGRTTYFWARNSPPGATVTTITLRPDQRAAYQRESSDGSRDTRIALAESTFDTFLYEGTDVAAKVTQLYGDSKVFDETPYVGRCDLVFVDGSHAKSYVESDTQKALRMLRPGGLLLWHDYTPAVPGVFQSLNELARKLPLVHLRGTSIVAYRRTGDAAPA